ncbi:MAG: LbtU family siderophore porin [Deltaproteobacteria bacterium]|nr:LbtU family siderophore porin [Deltaproteobacteria bacterium]
MRHCFSYILTLLIFTIIAINISPAILFANEINIGGLLETGLSIEQGYEENSSDITLSTVEIGIDAELNDMVQGNIVMLWEEDDTEQVIVDQASITVEDQGRYLTAGRICLPFGSYESNMVSDPLTLEIGETYESAVMAGIGFTNLSMALYAFNGDTAEELNSEDNIDHFGASIGYSMDAQSMSAAVGIDYINSIMDTDGLSSAVIEMSGETGMAADYAAGAAIHSTISFGPLTIAAEYLTALDKYTDLSGVTTMEPSAFTVEAGYSFQMAGKRAVLSIGYQGTEDMSGMLPEKRTLTCVSVEVKEGLNFGLEYARDEDYSNATGETADIINILLAIEF